MHFKLQPASVGGGGEGRGYAAILTEKEDDETRDRQQTRKNKLRRIGTTMILYSIILITSA